MVTKKEFNWQKFIKQFKGAEKLAVKWLRKKGFRIDYSHKGKSSNEPYDIIARKRVNGINRIWAIDVKSGKNPSVKLKNFKKLLEDRRFNMIGYVFIIRGKPFLLEYSKWSHFGDKAYKARMI